MVQARNMSIRHESRKLEFNDVFLYSSKWGFNGNSKRELLLSCWASSRQDTDNENIDRVCYLQFQVGMHRILIWPDILFPNFTGIQTCNSIFFLRFVNGFTWFVFGYPDTGTGI
jgi:hypothetical protein